MNLTEARNVLQREDEILDNPDTISVLIRKGSPVHQAIKTLAHPTLIDHLIETGAVTYADIFGSLQANGRDISPEEGKEILLATYKEQPVTAKLSDKECELLLSLMHDGHKLDTFKSSAVLRTLKKFTNLFVDARDDDILGGYFDRHYDQISDYCERMEKKDIEPYPGYNDGKAENDCEDECEDGYECEGCESGDEDESSEPILGYCIIAPLDPKRGPAHRFPVYGELSSDEFWKLFDIGKDGSSDDE
jgi:hypothetical protein